ncbi:MAG: hypothetical protein IPP74_09340 [Alphaproteobacteria bacterium]|nr:hypothetical protein [Alphaproteobacteria bacterium]
MKNLFSSPLLATTVLALSSALVASPAFANKKVYTPYVEAGELELEYHAQYQFDRKDAELDGAQSHELAIGYGVNHVWATELYGVFEQSGQHDDHLNFTDIEWENRFQLTEPGKYWLDVGFYLAYEKTLESHSPDTIEAKLLLAKNSGPFQNLANLILEKEVGPHAENLEGGLAWSTRYRYKEWFEPGVELFSSFGVLDENLSYDEQEHQFGPTIYGKIGHFKYDVGYLFGISNAAPNGELKTNFEYEVRF